MQHENGQHSELRAGITVLGMTLTADMQQSDRRVACDSSGSDDDPSSGSDGEDHDDDDEDGGGWGGGGCSWGGARGAQKRARRECEACDYDISDRPASHSVCLSCYRRGGKVKFTGLTQTLGQLYQPLIGILSQTAGST